MAAEPPPRRLWLPSLIYSEESDLKYRLGQTLDYKAQTRLWGYNLKDLRRNSEFTEITVDAPQSVQDQSQKAQDATPIEAQRAWERQAEINVLDRLQQIGLLAPEGEIDKVLQTVVNNVMVTNNLDIQPEIKCRVLMTTPLESFTIGHTIVVSRGMIDVLPDEASLAMILTHELAHIVLGHHLDTKLAFNDRMFFPDERTFERMDFARDRDRRRSRRQESHRTAQQLALQRQARQRRLVPQSGPGPRSAAEEPDPRRIWATACSMATPPECRR